MKICICGPVNPFELAGYLDETENILSINKGATAVNTYVKQLIRDGHKVVVVTSDVPLDVKSDITYKGELLTIHVVSSRPGFFLYHGLSRFYMVGRLRKYIRRILPDIEILHCQWTYDYAMAARAFENRIPTFCTVRDWCPYIITVQRSILKKIQWCLYYIQFRYVMRSDRITFIANSEYTRDRIVESYPRKNVPVIYNPIDQQLIIQERSSYSDDPVFVSIASNALEKRKNIPLLLEAFHVFLKEYPNSTLLLVGGGFTQDNPDLNSFKVNGWLNNVELLGQQTHQGVIEAIDRATCLVHPALEETFGNILLEGMARRVLVIGGEHAGAVPMVLESGASGLLCDVSSVDSVADAMRRSLDRKTTSGIIRHATQSLLMKYGSECVTKRHVVLYQNALQKTGC